MTHSTNLNGRTALITGGSRGLGKAMALALGAAGAQIALVGRDGAALESAAQACHAAGCPRAEAFCCDITQEDQVLELERQVSSKLGSIDILINNAGVNIRKNLTEFTLDEWRRVLDTNLTSVFLMCRSFVPHMQGRGYGRVLNLTSIMARVSLPGRAAYSSSKAALLGLTRALALELAQDNVTVVGISPGPFATEMNTSLMENPELNRQFLTSIPVGRWGKVEDIGSLALYLCSDAASFLTGTDILIDGGWCAR